MPTLLPDGLRALAGAVALAWCVACAAAPVGDIDELLLDEDNSAATLLADEQVQKAEAGGAGHEQELASALEQRAWVALLTGNMASAAAGADAERALSLREAAHETAALARPLALSAAHAIATGNRERGHDLLARAVAITAAPPRDRALALSLRAGVAIVAADYRGAANDYGAANAILAHGHGTDLLMLSRNLNNLTYSLSQLHDDDGARAAIARSIDIVGVRPGKESRAYAKALNQRGALAMESGDYWAARRDMEQAVAIDRRYPDVIKQRTFRTLLITLGSVCENTGDYVAARRAYGEAIDAEAHTGSASDQAFHGGIFDRAVNPDDYRARAERIDKALAAGSDGPRSEHRAVDYVNLGDAYLASGDAAKAGAAFARARELLGAALGETSPWLSIAVSGLGKAHLQDGRFEEARDDFERALGLSAKFGGGNSAGRDATLGLAQAQWGLGHVEQAFDLALRAENAGLALLRRNAPWMSEREGMAFSSQAESGLPLLLPLARIIDTDVARNDVWKAVMARRSLVTEAMAWRAALARSEHDAALRTDWDVWRKASARFGKASLDQAERPSDANAAGLAQAREALDRAEHALAGHLPAMRDFADADTRQISAALGANATLIAFVNADERGPRDAYLPEQSLPRALYALRVDASDAHLMLRRVEASATAAERLARWYADLRDPGTPAAQIERDGIAVRALAWDPIASELPARRVFIVPDGALYRVNWSALPDGENFLIERGYEFHLLDHERELLTQAPADAFGHGLLIAAAPDFDAGAGTGAARLRGGCDDELRFAPLPGSAREAALIEKQAPHESARVLTGPGATEEALRALAPQADNLHFATHGFARTGGCASPGARGFDLAPATAPLSASAQADLGALALAGANRGGADPDHDGLLTAEEVAALDLSHVHWVVLSSCDSGLGQWIDGEGIFGLRRGFRIAGARTVIMSLWPVADAATGDWMNRLYAARFGQKLDTAAALQAATLAALNARRAAGESTHPYYWASFVAAGDWH